MIVDPLRQKMVVDVDLSTLDLRQKLSCYNRQCVIGDRQIVLTSRKKVDNNVYSKIEAKTTEV